MSNLDIITWLRFAAWLVVGLAIYFFYGRRHARLANPNPDTVPE
ncbi:amino acid permease C-terminal domain-containing protein [Saccharopolyspora soli]